MKIMFLDTETTGLCDMRTPYTEDTLANVWPHLTKITWHIDEVDETFMARQVELQSHFIKPLYPESQYDPKAQEVTGIPYVGLQTYGHNLDEVMDKFCKDLNSIDIAVAHNTTFDMKMIKAELLRLNIDQHMRVCPWLDTVWYSKSFVNARDDKGRLKFPTLKQLADACQVDLTDRNLHDSDTDVAVLRQCFYRLVQEGVITPDRLQVRIETHKSTANK